MTTATTPTGTAVTASATVARADLANALAWIKPHVSRDSTRPILTHVLATVDTDAGRLTIDATDSFTLIRVSMDLAVAANVDGSFLIDPEPMFREIKPKVNNPGMVTIDHQGERTTMDAGTATMDVTAQTSAQFPDCAALTPEERSITEPTEPEKQRDVTRIGVGLKPEHLAKLSALKTPGAKNDQPVTRWRFISTLRPAVVTVEKAPGTLSATILVMPVRLP